MTEVTMSKAVYMNVRCRRLKRNKYPYMCMPESISCRWKI